MKNSINNAFKVAKKENALVENRKYAPITVVVGEGRLVPGFEKDLKKAKVGKAVSYTHLRAHETLSYHRSRNHL